MKEILLMALSLIGFAVSAYIFYSKRFDKPLFCLRWHDCDAVVRSRYGKTFGVENTIPGMGFYIIVFIYGLMQLLNQNVFKGVFVYYSIVGISVVSVLFSLYLVYVQKFILRQWCVYCIVSTISSILILIVLAV